MFGLIHGLFYLGGCIGKSCSNIFKDAVLQNEARDNNDVWYIGSDGKSHLTSTGEAVFLTEDDKGDRVFKSIKTGKVVYNYNDFERVDSIYESKIKGYSTFLYRKRGVYNKPGIPSGDQYMDLKDGRTYVVRKCKNRYLNYTHYYYVDIETCRLVRRTDGDIEREKWLKNNGYPIDSIEDIENCMIEINRDLDEYSKGSKNKKSTAIFHLDMYKTHDGDEFEVSNCEIVKWGNRYE